MLHSLIDGATTLHVTRGSTPMPERFPTKFSKIISLCREAWVCVIACQEHDLFQLMFKIGNNMNKIYSIEIYFIEIYFIEI